MTYILLNWNFSASMLTLQLHRLDGGVASDGLLKCLGGDCLSKCLRGFELLVPFDAQKLDILIVILVFG